MFEVGVSITRRSLNTQADLTPVGQGGCAWALQVASLRRRSATTTPTRHPAAKAPHNKETTPVGSARHSSGMSGVGSFEAEWDRVGFAKA